MNILLNKTLNQAVVLAGNADRNMSEEIKYAALNTLVGMSVVFGVLIIIIIIISLFKFIPVLQSKFSKNTDASVSGAIEAEQAQIVSQEAEEEELVDDYELVAVITAAIHASMGTEAPADGLVVRSIKRVGRRNRLNA